MKQPKISLGVVVENGLEKLSRCLESVCGIVSEIVLINAQTKDDINKIIKTYGAKLVAGIDQSAASARNLTVEASSGDWLLILEPWEYITENALPLIKKLCLSGKPAAHAFLCKKVFGQNEFNAYEWVGSMGKLSADAVRCHGYVSMVDARLFPLKKKALRFFDDDFGGIFFNAAEINCETIFHQEISIEFDHSGINSSEELGNDVKFRKDIEKLKGSRHGRQEDYAKFVRMNPDHVSYASMDIKDFRAIKEGLANGFGNRSILNYMMDYLYKFGWYEKGVELFEAVPDRFADNPEIYNYAGLLYFGIKALDKAEDAWLKALAIEASNVGYLENIGMLYLVKNAFEKAEVYFQRSLAIDPSRVHIKKMLAQMASNQNKKPMLSLGMIAKNEEDYIGRALTSVKNLVDEMIVIDTGSIDGTAEVAKRHGAYVYYTDWDEDFSRARNAVVKYARGDYILLLDADEYVEQRAIVDLMVFISLLPLKEKKAYYLKLNQRIEDQVKQMIRLPSHRQDTLKLFLLPNSLDIRFEGSAMEGVDQSLERLKIPKQFVNEASIRHDSNNVEERKKRKIAAMRKLFDEALDADKYLDGAIFFLSLNRVDEALPWLEKACETGMERPWYPFLAVKLARMYYQRDERQRSKILYETVYQKFPFCVPVGYAYGEFLYHEGAFDRAVKIFDAVGAHDNGFELGPEDTEKIKFYQAISMVETDDFAGAEKKFAGILKNNPLSARARSGMVYLAAKGGDLEGCVIETTMLASCLDGREMPMINSIEDLVHRCALVIEKMKGKKMEEESLVMLKTANVLLEYEFIMRKARN